MKNLFLLVVVVGSLCCGSSEPVPQPPPPTTTAPCEPVPVPEPEPIPEPTPLPQPEDYIALTRAGELGDRCVDSTGLLQTLCFYEQELIWDGIRNPEYAMKHCCAELPGPWPFVVMNNGEGCTSPDIEVNRQVYQELLGFMDRLQQVNRRCDALPRFCGRTDVRKDRFAEWRTNLLNPAIELSRKLNGAAGWCQAMK